MSKLARDIKRTLCIKALLLFLLWFVCFRPAEKPVIDAPTWFLGKTLHPAKEVTAYDSKP